MGPVRQREKGWGLLASQRKKRGREADTRAQDVGQRKKREERVCLLGRAQGRGRMGYRGATRPSGREREGRGLTFLPSFLFYFKSHLKFI